MTTRLPFLRPDLVPLEAYEARLRSIDASHLYSNFGPLNTQLETRILQEVFGGTGALTTVSNATLGLMLAISQVKRPAGRYAVMPSFTFAAAPLAAQWCGLEPYFLDVREGDWTLDPGQLETALAALGDQVAVVMPYPTFGTHLDLEPFARLHRRGIPVVVDAAPCFGTENPEGPLGLGFPGMVVFSFHATKAFGLGEAGMVYSADAAALARVRQASNFGFSKAREATLLGCNAKLSEYTAALGLATLDAFGPKKAIRRTIHDWYLEELDGAGLIRAGWVPQAAQGSVPSQFLPLLCPPGMGNAGTVAHLEQRGIEARTYFSPSCHQQEQFRTAPRMALPFTEELSRRILSLPLWERMTRGEVQRVVAALAERTP